MPKTKALTDAQAAKLRERVEIIQFLNQLQQLIGERSLALRDCDNWLEGAGVPLDTEPPPVPPEPPANRAEARRQERAAKRAKVEADAAARKADAAKKAAKAKKATKKRAPRKASPKLAVVEGAGGTA